MTIIGTWINAAHGPSYINKKKRNACTECERTCKPNVIANGISE